MTTNANIQAVTEEVRNVISNNQFLEYKVSAEKMMELTRGMYQNNFFVIWVREVLQNAVDAAAKNIDIWNDYIPADSEKTGPDDLHITRLKVRDDGCGMSLYVIMNKFLALGESQKLNKEAAGGFGIANTIITFGTVKGETPYRNEGVYWYAVTTSEEEGALKSYYFDSEMIGKEPVRQIEPKSHAGTEIVVYRKEYCTNRKIIRVLENSSVTAKLRYNGDEMIQLRRARLKAELSWCKVYHKKKAEPHQAGNMIVRINGIYQFDEHLTDRMPGVAIVEIETDKRPGDPLYPLTPNREQLKAERDINFRLELNRILENFKGPEQLAEEAEPFVMETLYNPNFVPPLPEEEVETNPQERKKQQEVKMRNLTPEEWAEEEAWREKFEVSNGKIKAFEEELANSIEASAEREVYRKKQFEEELKRARMAKIWDVWKELKTPHVHFEGSDVIRPEYITEKERKQTFDAMIPSVTIKRDRGYHSQIDLFNRKNIKILLAFQALVESVFRLASEDIPRFDYHLGFVLSEASKAEYIRKDGKVYILINPSGLTVGDVNHFFDIIIHRIVHELLHHRLSWHDEYFVVKLHHVLEKYIYPERKPLIKMVREILRG